MHLTLHFVIITLFFITFFSYLKEKGDSFTKPSPVLDSSFQSPAPFREQRAYRGEYPASWNPHFSKEFKESFLYRGKVFEKSFTL